MTDRIIDIDFNDPETQVTLRKDDRRTGIDRRHFSYSLYIPERRTGKNRRSGEDRRKLPRIKIE